MCWAELSLRKNSPPDGAYQQTALCSTDTSSPTSHTAFISRSLSVNKRSWIDKHTYISHRSPKRWSEQKPCSVLHFIPLIQQPNPPKPSGSRVLFQTDKHSSITDIQTEGGISGWSASPYALKPLQQVKSDRFHKFCYVKSRAYSNKHISKISIYTFHFLVIPQGTPSFLFLIPEPLAITQTPTLTEGCVHLSLG